MGCALVCAGVEIDFLPKRQAISFRYPNLDVRFSVLGLAMGAIDAGIAFACIVLDEAAALLGLLTVFFLLFQKVLWRERHLDPLVVDFDIRYIAGRNAFARAYSAAMRQRLCGGALAHELVIGRLDQFLDRVEYEITAQVGGGESGSRQVHCQAKAKCGDCVTHEGQAAAHQAVILHVTVSSYSIVFIGAVLSLNGAIVNGHTVVRPLHSICKVQA